jgi:hypothetical protein
MQILLQKFNIDKKTCVSLLVSSALDDSGQRIEMEVAAA